MWLTLIWHMGLKMPWCWKAGPSTSSERNHLLELLPTANFPAQTLFCADAGFVGYEFWKAILDAAMEGAREAMPAPNGSHPGGASRQAN
jgi:hypothetical protein